MIISPYVQFSKKTSNTSVKEETIVTWVNEDSTLHTGMSGTPEGGNSGTEFDRLY
jgi:hypothetical protein